MVEYENGCSVMMFLGDHPCLVDGHCGIVVVEKGGSVRYLPIVMVAQVWLLQRLCLDYTMSCNV